MQITSGKATLAAESHGTGEPTVLLIHAGVTDQRSWSHVVDRLPDHRCLTYDARGYGRTTYEPEDGWSYVGDAVAVLDAYDVDAAVVVGASKGGRTAIDLTLAHRERVRGLVLIGPAVSGAPEQRSSRGPTPGGGAGRRRGADDLDEINRLEAHLWLDGPLADEGRVTGPVRDLFLEMNARALAAPDPGERAAAVPAWDRLERSPFPRWSWSARSTSGRSGMAASTPRATSPERGSSSSPMWLIFRTSRATRPPCPRSPRSSEVSPPRSETPAAKVGSARHPLTIRPVRRRRRYGVPPHVTNAPAMLVLEDGRTFRGRAYGADGETFGEAVFATGMTGYQETLTDPSYHRQVVVMTAPHIGNTGMNDEDPESERIWVAGYVVRDPARVPSSWRSRRSFDDALRDQGVVGISGIDTRALTRHLRERGAMRVGISTTETDPDALLSRVRGSAEMAGANLSDEVSTGETYVVPAVGERRFTVAALDLGIKANTPRMLAERGVETHVLPATATLDDVRAVEPDGLFFSNGPGDPAATTGQVELLRGALELGLPYFGICFGNQLFGRALGFDTYKLTYGHRGINQPVLDRTTGKVEVTAHNHGFAVRAPSTPRPPRRTAGRR